MTAALELDKVRVRLGRRRVLQDISARIAPGGFTAVCGPNGAGKTTLLRAALGLAPLEAGRISLFGDDPRHLAPAERASRIAYLPQDRRVAWGMSALAVAALGAIGAPVEDAEARAREALARVGLADLAERSVFEMSGGERARVLLARLLATRAPVLVLDEPTAGLDPAAQLLTLELLKAEIAERGATVVATLHDLSLCARFADRVLVLEDGCLVADGCFQDALDAQVLRRVFHLEAEWIEARWGTTLSASRASTV
jgi:iron complex transport system ATP-binding protein